MMEVENKTRVSMSWSGGKDCALALWLLQNDRQMEVVSLHTTIEERTGRVGLHGVHEALIEHQAEIIGLPLEKIYFPQSGDNQAYENTMGAYLQKLSDSDIKHIAFGDILLEDLKRYREKMLMTKGFEGVFPLWNKNTEHVAKTIIEKGFKTKICAADADKIDKQWVGEDFTTAFIRGLSKGVDPCGEHGEFHTFCYDGPIFKKRLNIRVNELIARSYDLEKEDGEKQKKGFWFADLIMAQEV